MREVKGWKNVLFGTLTGAAGWLLAVSMYLVPGPARAIPYVFLIWSPFLV